jgi:hypothetical protein
MGFRVQYTSRRREVWDWYWRAWRERLWKTHLLVFLTVSVTVYLYEEESAALSPAAAVLAFACGLISILWLPLYPLVMFKPQVRTLEIDQDGISTTIGRRSARRAWVDIRSVSEQDGYIIILNRNGNAFIVPPRAFASMEERQGFVSFLQNAVTATPKHASR